MSVKGSVAYVEQEPFIMSDTFLENLLFGNELDEVSSIESNSLEMTRNGD